MSSDGVFCDQWSWPKSNVFCVFNHSVDDITHRVFPRAPRFFCLSLSVLSLGSGSRLEVPEHLFLVVLHSFPTLLRGLDILSFLDIILARIWLETKVVIHFLEGLVTQDGEEIQSGGYNCVSVFCHASKSWHPVTTEILWILVYRCRH